MILCAGVITLLGSCGSPPDVRLLFIGNSFTNDNQLDQLVAELAVRAVPEWDNVYATRVTYNGYLLAYHLADAEGRGQNPRLRELLVAGTEAEAGWDLVVLQAQSQIPAFPDSLPDKQSMRAAAAQLHTYSQERGATTMLLLTWGYAAGDPDNSELFPTFTTMQERLTAGYADLESHLSRNGARAYTIPAGPGFAAVYRSVRNNGGNPQAAGSPFGRLYAPDNKHPSLAGSYLTASIVVAAYTGQRVEPVEWHPSGLAAEDASYLRRIADFVVFEAEAGRRYPWQN